MMFKRSLSKNFDKTFLLVALLIFIIGILTVYSATQARNLPFSESFFVKQAVWMLIAVLFMIIALAVSYQRFIDISYVIYALNVLLLIFVLVLGKSRLGAQRWFPIGAFAFQPSEFIKLSLILVLSGYVGARKDTMARAGNMVIPCILLGIPFALVLLQPDLGTALLLLPIFLSILVVGGASLKYINGMLVAGLAVIPVFWHFLKGYQKQRLLVFINPNIDPLGAGYNIIQSKISVGSGGLLGKGWLNGTQNQLNFLPERHTDFIFSVIGEEFGFIGAAALVLLYFVLVKKAFTISNTTSDMYGKCVATGVGMLLAMQVIINIGMTIGLMPVVGIPLPLVSYGGSSLLSTMIAIGLLLNVGMRRSTF
ncbi:MAG: rod shape-determining protein RodA [Candidatus Omnitrophica bacterium]|nr:rod shape-determining protein RodA [Candidatus Omnitrophota bacterium]